MNKKMYLLAVLCLFAITSAFSQTIKNGAFENWNITPVDLPNGWFNSNQENQGKGTGLINISKVTGQSGSAIKLETKSNSKDTMFGFFNSTDGDPVAGEGGWPYSQKPDSITGYYQYNVQSGDSAILLVVFKKNGAVVSIDVFKITGTQSTFKRFAFPLSLSVTPDSVIIASASSNALDEIGVKPGSTITWDELAFKGTGVTQAIPNGNFDSWTASSIDELLNWGTMGKSTRTTDKYKGNYAVMLETRTEDMGTFASGITNGIVTQNSTIGGVPFTSLMDTLVFYYKYTPSGTDSGQLFISTTKNTSPVGGRVMPLAPASSYTRMEVPFQSFSAPDTLRIEFFSSRFPANSSNDGSKLYIDEVQLKSQPINTGIFKPVTNTGFVKAYPNPVSDNLTIFSGNASKSILTITDIQGRIVAQHGVSGGEITLPVSHLTEGVYFYQLAGEDWTASGRFYKQ